MYSIRIIFLSCELSVHHHPIRVHHHNRFWFDLVCFVLFFSIDLTLLVFYFSLFVIHETSTKLKMSLILGISCLYVRISVFILSGKSNATSSHHKSIIDWFLINIYFFFLIQMIIRHLYLHHFLDLRYRKSS